MVSVTIPKNITKGEELVVIPKKLYERFLRVLKKNAITLSAVKLNKGLMEALDDVENNRVLGPFVTLKDGLKALKKTDK